MPRPVPPPPPQPSAEETAQAVRYLHVVVGVALLFFVWWGWVGYGPDSFIQPWGRTSSQSWMVHKARGLDEADLRAHDGGDIVWLVGSSILREATDVRAVNAILAERGSRYRVETFCQGRGAAGLASGMVRQLPIRSGDLVIHNVALQNLRLDWLAWTGLPPARMSRMLDPDALWQTREWGLPERLEQAAAIPTGFWRWHDDTRAGFTHWITHLMYGTLPKKRHPRVFYRFSKRERASIFASGVPDWEIERNLLTVDTIDLSPRQFNIQGLERLRVWATEAAVELVLLHIPPSAYAQWNLETPAARDAYAEWLHAQPEMVFAPQLLDRDFYDRRHPNFRGREKLSTWLADWVDSDRPRGTHAVPPRSSAVAYPWTTPPSGDATHDDLEAQ